MAIHVRRKRVPPAWLFVLAALTVSPWAARAQGRVNFYSATAARGTENDGVIPNAGTVPQAQRRIGARNYNTAAPKMAMLVDAVALPANGAVLRMQLPVQAAMGGSLPSCGSITLPAGVVASNKEIVIAASTTGRTWLAGTRTGGNSLAEVGY
jgi:hypothetical protein